LALLGNTKAQSLFFKVGKIFAACSNLVKNKDMSNNEEIKFSFGPPLNLERDLFNETDNCDDNALRQIDPLLEGSVKEYEFPGNVILKIREFYFSVSNANFVWKGNEYFAQWILDNKHYFENKKILELATGTGILSIFLKKQVYLRLGCYVQ
jgi:methylase of polypeptide subunit release factors